MMQVLDLSQEGAEGGEELAGEILNVLEKGAKLLRRSELSLNLMCVKALLPLSALALISCVVSYKVSSNDPTQRDLSATRNVHVFYHIRPVSDKEHRWAIWNYTGYFLGILNLPNPLVWYDYPSSPTSYVLSNPWDDLQRKLSNHQLFLQATETESPPEQGIYFSVDAAYYPKDPKMMWECPSFPSVFTLGILPYYCDKSGVIVRYELFIDHQQKKSYQYEIKKKGAAGLLLLPFAWANFFTDDLGDAIVLTAHQFILDAQRDGYLSLELMEQPVLARPPSNQPR